MTGKTKVPVERCKQVDHEWFNTLKRVGDRLIWQCRKCRYSLIQEQDPRAISIKAINQTIRIREHREQ